MKVTFEMTEQEAAEYLRFKKCKTDKREMRELTELADRLGRLANVVYKALALTEDEYDVTIINETYARAALALAQKEIF